MSSSEARAALHDIIDRVGQGEEVTITRHGRAVAVVVSPDALGVRRATKAFGDAEHLGDLLRRARSTRLDEAPSLSNERAEQLVAELEASRAER